MSPEEWKEAEKRLEDLYRSVELNCDGYILTLQLVQISPYRNQISMYINGWFKGEWLINDCEERRRFFQKKDVFIYKPKERARLKKVRKSTLKSLNIDPDRHFSSYSSHWPSFRALKRHLIANNKSIELLRNVAEAGAIPAGEAL